MHSTQCPYCGVTGHEEREVFVATVEHCHQCRVDILMKGQWTGYGWQALTRFLDRHPECRSAPAMTTMRTGDGSL